jgi:hypothetical protein
MGSREGEAGEVRKLRTEEQETTFTIEANRKVVCVLSGDPVYQRRLERVGATLIEAMEDGGKFYELPANQVRITKPRSKLTDEQRADLARRLHNGRKPVREKR